ncbi:MAG: Hpt domain-containing protein [Nitrospinaceae bacterium]
MTHPAKGDENEKIIVEIDPDLEELIPGYLDNRHKDLKTLRAALEQDDFETIQRLGHTMKGSGAGYGFDLISAIGLTMEEGAKEKSAEKIRATADELLDFLNRVEVVFK